MAYKSFSLPPLKLTKRPTFGATTKKDVHRVTKQQLNSNSVSMKQVDESIGETEIMRRYPVNDNVDIEDPETTSEHKRAIGNELAKAKPRDSVLLPLMKSTYGERRMFILSDEISVQDILNEYPALSRSSIVSC